MAGLYQMFTGNIRPGYQGMRVNNPAGAPGAVGGSNAIFPQVKQKTQYGGKLGEMFQDPSFNYTTGPVGPGIEDDSAAYNNFLQAGEAARTREENRATENVLGNLQGRGLATSGIALKDVLEQVIGPSAERAGSMAAQFGLEQARRRSDLLENERNAARDLNKMGYQGRLDALFNDQNFNYDMQKIERQRQIEDQRAKEAQARKRRGALGGGILGGIGGYFGGMPGASIGYNAGSSLG